MKTRQLKNTTYAPRSHLTSPFPIMHLKNTLTTLLFTCALCTPLFAQFGHPLLGLKTGMISEEELKDFEANVIIFMLPDIDETEYNKLVKKGKTEEAQNIKAQNDSIIALVKRVVPEYWRLHESVTFKTYDEVRSMNAKGQRNCSILAMVGWYKHEDSHPDPKYGNDAVYGTFETFDEKRNDTSGHYGFIQKTLTLGSMQGTEDGTAFVKKAYQNVTMNKFYLTENDLIEALDILQWLITETKNDPDFSTRKFKKNISDLDTYTLAINRDTWWPEFPIDTIADIYTGKYELVDSATYNRILHEGQPGYAVLIKYRAYLLALESDTRQFAFFPDMGDGLGQKPESIDYIKPRDLIDFQEEIVEHKEKQAEKKKGKGVKE